MNVLTLLEMKELELYKVKAHDNSLLKDFRLIFMQKNHFDLKDILESVLVLALFLQSLNLHLPQQISQSLFTFQVK